MAEVIRASNAWDKAVLRSALLSVDLNCVRLLSDGRNRDYRQDGWKGTCLFIQSSVAKMLATVGATSEMQRLRELVAYQELGKNSPNHTSCMLRVHSRKP